MTLIRVRRLVRPLASWLLAACGGAALAQGPCEVGERFFDHPLLATEPVCLPAAPERLVIADFAAFDLSYTLELPVSGYWGLMLDGWYANMVPELLPMLEAYLGSATDVGAIPLNIEAIVAAQPDLILVNSLLVAGDEGYRQLAAVAPTVVKRETSSDSWREHVRFYGDALGVAEEAEALLGAYDTRVAALRAAADGAFDGKTASLVQVNDPRTLYLNVPSYRGWALLKEAGFEPSSAQRALQDTPAARESPALPLSDERLDLLATDYLVLMNAAFDAETSEAVRALVASYATNPLWQNLPAVKEGRLYVVDLAWQATGLISAHAALDDMFRLFLGREPSVPNPYAEQVAR